MRRTGYLVLFTCLKLHLYQNQAIYVAISVLKESSAWRRVFTSASDVEIFRMSSMKIFQAFLGCSLEEIIE